MPSTEPTKPDSDIESDAFDYDPSKVDTYHFADDDAQPDAHEDQPSAEYVAYLNKLRTYRDGYGSQSAADARADTLCWLIRDACHSHPDDSTATILERLASLYRAGADGAAGQQSGSGHQPAPHDLRTTGALAGEPDGAAAGDYPPGRAASLPEPAGESGALPDADTHTHARYPLKDEYYITHTHPRDRRYTSHTHIGYSYSIYPRRST